MNFRDVTAVGLMLLVSCSYPYGEAREDESAGAVEGENPSEGGSPREPGGGEAPAEGQPGLVEGPSMRVEGRHIFSAVPTVEGASIEWRLERQSAAGIELLEEATGAEVEFELPFTLGGRYVVGARDGTFDESLIVQVFPANTRVVFQYESAGNPEVPVHIIVPSDASGASRVLLVHHGASRNADDYCDRWSAWVLRADYLVVCPEFNDSEWSGSAGYNLGNVFSGSDGAGDRNPESQWAFTLAEDIYLEIKEGFGLTAEEYDVWGHSAGAQFVHRTLIFNPDAPIRYAIAANAGWYTAPDLAVEFPYGLSHPRLSFTAAGVTALSERNLIIMRGTEDTNRSDNLRQTPEADAQGQDRYERAGYMYERGVALGGNVRWQLIDVPGVGHSSTLMAPAAMDFLEMNAAAP